MPASRTLFRPVPQFWRMRMLRKILFTAGIGYLFRKLSGRRGPRGGYGRY